MRKTERVPSWVTDGWYSNNPGAQALAVARYHKPVTDESERRAARVRARSVIPVRPLREVLVSNANAVLLVQQGGMMDVALIEMPAEVARTELQKYRTSLHRRADAEYQEIAEGLTELAKGTPLLQLSRVFEQAPLDAKGRPRIAIARADRLRVRVDTKTWRSSSSQLQFDCAYDQRRGARALDTLIYVQRPSHWTGENVVGYALVPIVPPDVRGTKNLKDHFILWEVEQWADRAGAVGPDIDPYLLRRISADLFAVVGEWDLTPLEQAILAGRRER